MNIRLTVFICVAVLTLGIPFAHSDIPTEERDALIALWDDTDGANWTNSSGWRTGPGFSPPGSECSWIGVTCSGNTAVIRLQLPDNGLVGTLPAELADLSSLTHLELQGNSLGDAIPPELGTLSNLTVLGLEANQLLGEIPTQLANLTNITSTGLQLGWNALYTDDPTLQAFIDARHIHSGGYVGTWESTQTVAPDNIVLATIHDTSAWLTWDIIDYSTIHGWYQFYYSVVGSGTWTTAGWTWSKTDTAFPITGLTPGTNYLFAIQTFTFAHTNNKNDVSSEFGAIMPGTTSTIGCAAPVMVVPEGIYPATLSLTETYGTYEWITGGTTATIEAFEEVKGWYWVDVTWGGGCREAAVGYVEPLNILSDGFESSNFGGWTAVVGDI